MKRFRLLGLATVTLAMIPATAYGFIRDPWIQDVSKTTVTITWEATTTGGTQELHWGPAADSLDNRVAGELVDGNLYRAQVEDLEVSTSGYYRVLSDGEASEPATFVTATCETEPFVFVGTGDNRDGVASHQAVVDAIIAHGGGPDFMINTGDIVDGTDYLEFFDVEKVLLKDVPVFPAAGNHDSPSEFQYGFDRALYYAYDYGNTRFIAINTDGDYMQGSVQHDWITAELQTAHLRKNAGQLDWIVVYHHHPAFSSGSHGNEAGVISDLLPLYELHEVDLVVNGHDHHYERSLVNGITHIVTGGGGVNLRSVTCDTGNGCVIAQSIHHFTQFTVDGGVMTIRAIDTSGNVIDSVQLVNGEPASGEPCNAAGEEPPKGPGGEPTDPPVSGGPGVTISGGCTCSVAPASPMSAKWSFGLAVLALGAVVIRRRRKIN